MKKNLLRINWQTFRTRNLDQTKAFEELCYHLFCRKYNKQGVRADHNQKGLETHPILIGKEYIGFQAKFFDNKLSDASSVKQINHSVTLAKSAYPKLKKILIYTHQSFGATNPIYKRNIEKKAKPLKIEWVVDSHFQTLLFQPCNLDLAHLYFGKSDELGFIKNSSNPFTFTLLQSAEFIHLPLTDNSNKAINDLPAEILNAPNIEFMVSGSPGSGKSILMHRLFQQFGGLDQKNDAAMMRVITKQGAVPMLVNLKNCDTDSLENIVRGRQQDNNVRGKVYNFIYLFDGLDELPEHKANKVLHYIFELSHKADTCKIILSCRTGSLNKTRAKVYLKGITDIKITALAVHHINGYFLGKGDGNRLKKLDLFKKNNSSVLADIKDILLTHIFWEVIEELPLTANTIDLLERKIKLLLHDPNHHKNIEDLNLLNPKEDQLLAINQDISFAFQKKFQFRFPQENLQRLIGEKLPRIDYHSINTILNYIADLFFDTDHSVTTGTPRFIYQHRRYQEFFFAQKLKIEYDKDPNVLRQLRVLSSHDFFYTFFLPYLRNEYTKDNDLIGFIGLNLIDVYLGNHKGWGADNAYYKDSKQFIESLAAQSDHVFEQILNDENLDIKAKLFIPEVYLLQAFKEFRKDSRKYPEDQDLKEVWENDVPNLIRLVALLHKNGKFEFKNEVEGHLGKVLAIFKEESFREKYKNTRKEHLEDPAWKEWENYLYNEIIINRKDLGEVYKDKIASHYLELSDTDYDTGKEQGKTKLIKGFIRVCLEYKATEFLELIPSFDEYQFLSLLEVLTEFAYLPHFFKNSALKELINKIIDQPPFHFTKLNAAFVFFKKILKKPISEEEVSVARNEFKELEKTRSVDMRLFKTHFRCAILSHIFNRYNFEMFQAEDRNNSLRFYNELGVFCSLFTDYVYLLDHNKELISICGDFSRYTNFYTKEKSRNKYLIDEMTLLWSRIFIHADVDWQTKQLLAKNIIIGDNNIKRLDFYLHIRQSKKDLYLQLVNEADIDEFTKSLHQNDVFFQYYIDQCFDMSMMYNGINDSKSIEYFTKGINDGIVRHGYRKDYIVSYFLTDALEILLRNKWDSETQLKKYTKEVLKLAIRVRNITDGKGTQHGPYTLIKRLAKYDPEYARVLEAELEEKIGGHSNETTASIINAKIATGLPLEELETEMGRFRKGYTYENKPNKDFYTEKFKLYLYVAANLFYSPLERKKAFESAYHQIEEILEQEYSYFNFQDELGDEIDIYKRLCSQYEKENNIPDDTDPNRFKRKEYSPENETNFVSQLLQVKNADQLSKLYDELNPSSERMELRKTESWETLVEKTFQIQGNIELLIDRFRKDNYPHLDYFTTNAKYYHLGIAAALANINTRNEMIKYLSTDSGHMGFVNIMKAYEVLRDGNMCLLLFKRFLQFCNLLVN